MGFKIVVIGTGIGGLSAAIALSRQGHQVTVLEASPKLQSVGGIIVAQANAVRLLDRWGVYESFLKICRDQPHEIEQRRYTGELLSTIPAGNSNEEYGYPLWTIHRIDYQRVLFEAAVQNGATVRLGCAVVTVDGESAEPSVTLKSGEVVRADIVIGADGVKSVTRDCLNTESERGVEFSGMDITRMNIPHEVMNSDPLTAAIADKVSLWLGPDTTVANVPVLHDGQWYTGYDFLHLKCPSSEPGHPRPMDLDDLHQRFAAWGPEMQKVLSHVHEAHVWQINMTFPKHWISTSGRVVLLGDACHAVVPNVGQGGGMAIEDAATIVECLARAGSNRADIATYLRAYPEIRKPRCKLIQDRGKFLQKHMMVKDGSEQEARDNNLRNFKAVEQKVPWDGVHIDELPEGVMAKNYRAWQDGHDASLFANKKLDEMFGPATNGKHANGVSNGTHRSARIVCELLNPATAASLI